MGRELGETDELFGRWWDIRSTRALGIASLSAVIVTFFIVQEASGRWPAVEEYAARWDRIRDGEPWRLITGSLLNYRGLPHIAANLAMLIVFGRTVERVIGPARTVAVFFVGGSLAWLAMFTGSPGSWGSGSSAGVTAILGCGAAVAVSHRAWRHRERRLYLVSVLITMAVILLVDLTSWGFAGHGGGFVAGYALGSLIQVGANRADLERIDNLPAQPRY